VWMGVGLRSKDSFLLNQKFSMTRSRGAFAAMPPANFQGLRIGNSAETKHCR
jgi:hypothetical protein